ncbi:hypothetical protein ANCCAN_20861 [Ancylostoma caninum]|uniref:Uncharacterized protein n=1 Tax=Ancylostoma caninum TaxID=29170 RepID=A0A368FR49_ANCCA|nr:hypothetical protein ANCCAN_20861 [Ancylostoma caninum]
MLQDHTHNTTNSRRRGNTYKSIRSKEFWQQMIAVQSHWIENVQSSSFSRPAVVAHALESWKLLTKTYSYLRSRPIELQNSVQLYMVNAVKLLEFLIQRGYNVSHIYDSTSVL